MYHRTNTPADWMPPVFMQRSVADADCLALLCPKRSVKRFRVGLSSEFALEALVGSVAKSELREGLGNRIAAVTTVAIRDKQKKAEDLALQ